MDTKNMITVVILAVVLMILLPMVAARTGNKSLGQALFSTLSPRKRGPLGLDMSGSSKKKDRHISNGHKGDLTDMVNQLLKVCQQNGYTLVYPGTVTEGSRASTLLAFVVTKRCAVGIHCYGFSGEIRPGSSTNGPWKQHMNGADNDIPNPLQAADAEYKFVRGVMNAHKLDKIPLEIMTVYTSRELTLSVPENANVHAKERALELLRQDRYKTGPVEDPHAAAVAINALVVKQTKSKKTR